MSDRSIWWRAIGPGLIFSGAAVGISHLVQSTRAGAMFGLALVGVILLINLLKYPAFRFGVDYSHGTRRSLLSGYRELGLWAPLLFLIVLAPLVPIVLAAIAATTAGILAAIGGPMLSIPLFASLVLGAAGLLLVVGGYAWLDRVNRLLLAFLVISTLATTLLVLPRVEWGTLVAIGWAADPMALLFIVALAGFMPNPLDASVAVSLWTIEGEKPHGQEKPIPLAVARAGFAWSYGLSALLALCFCIMGAGVMHSAATAPAPDAAGFAAQVIDLYRQTLGPIPALLAAIAALSVMLTTAIAATDAYGRTYAAAWDELAGTGHGTRFGASYVVFTLGWIALAVGALFLLLAEFASFIDLVTSTSFLIAPVIALLNHLVVTRCAIPDEARPGPAMRWLSITAIVVMAAIAVMYLVLRAG